MAFENEFEGLAGFEELESYKVVKQIKKKGAIQLLKSGKGKKLRTSQSCDETAFKKKRKIEDGQRTLKTAKKRKCEKPIKSNVPKKKHATEISVENNDPGEASKTNLEETLVNASPWRSIFTPELIIKAIIKLGFAQPTEIQRLTIPSAIKGHKDIIGAAETGSGKTLAFGIPILNGILFDKKKEAKLQEQSTEEEEDNAFNPETSIDSECNFENDSENSSSETESLGKDKTAEMQTTLGCVKVIEDAKFDFLPEPSIGQSKNPLRALIITPTRELAVQIKNHIDALLLYTDITTSLVIGGLCQQKQERLLQKEPDIVIGTPGRLWQMIQLGNPHLGQASSIKYLAIDEADRLLEGGHFEELRQLLALLNTDEETKRLRQNFIFSATLTLEHDVPQRLSKKYKKEVKRVTKDAKLANLVELVGLSPKHKLVDATLKSKTAETLSEGKILCNEDEKELYLYYFIKNFPGRTLVFCNSIDCVRRLNNLFSLLKCNPQSLHASKHQKQRLKSLERFTANQEALLLATDVAARGLDIPGIDHILHYEVPKTAETYIHRSGRTARAQKGGLSILLISPAEMARFRKVFSTLERNSDLATFPVNNIFLDQLKDCVNLAKNVEIAEFRMKKDVFQDKWLGKICEDDMSDFIYQKKNSLEEEELSCQQGMLKKKKRQQIKIMRHQLNEAISRPLLTAKFSTKYPTSTGALELPKLVTFSKEKKNNALNVFHKESEEYSKLSQTVRYKPPFSKTGKKKEKEAKKRQRRRLKKRKNKNNED